MMIILTDFTNPDKNNKITKPWSSGNPDCFVKNNITGRNQFQQVIIWMKPFEVPLRSVKMNR